MDIHIPAKLADVITKHKCELNLSVEDISALSHLIDPQIDGCLMGKVSPAYLLGLTYFPGTPKAIKDFHVLGVHQSQQCSYATSRIIGVSNDLTQVKTQSGSIYEISDVKTSEPPVCLILHLCHTLNYWGIGKYFGVLDVYY